MDPHLELIVSSCPMRHRQFLPRTCKVLGRDPGMNLGVAEDAVLAVTFPTRTVENILQAATQQISLLLSDVMISSHGILSAE